MGLCVDLASLAGGIRELEEDVCRIGHLISQVYEETEELNGMWSGPGHQMFQKMAVEDKERMTEIFLDFQKMTEEMEAVQQEYEACEEAVADIVRAIRI